MVSLPPQRNLKIKKKLNRNFIQNTPYAITPPSPTVG